MLRAALGGDRPERERLANKLAEVLDHVYAAMPVAADGTGPLGRAQRSASHRIPKEARWLRVVPGLALPLGLARVIRRAAAVAHPATAVGAPGQLRPCRRPWWR